VTDEEFHAQQRARRRAAMGGHREYAISRRFAERYPDDEQLCNAVATFRSWHQAGPAGAAEAWAHVRYARDLIEALS